MSKLGRQRRTPAERIVARRARARGGRTPADARGKHRDAPDNPGPREFTEMILGGTLTERHRPINPHTVRR